MFGLCSGFFHSLFSAPEYQVLVLGLDDSGKTTIVEKAKQLFMGIPAPPPEKARPTIGLNIGRIRVDGMKLVLWDLGGKHALRAIWEKYYPDAHALIYVIDVANPDRFSESFAELERLLANPDACQIPVLVVANKIDVTTHDSSVLNTVHSRALGCFRISRLCLFHPMSGLSTEGVREGLCFLANNLRSRSASLP
eukprot:gnl/Spiro4/21782_TR10681_c0_g1_i1.p1 gnl/Spiro4/21782_TR10681_c0_g1~~gnl/Spiro4/21782_TR10681_c0_g1_i1.p1  ORF type:complete len:195 (-),score=26.73 gnl/Spiro4/21782_TR10681_c0_g1_i1:140-724(-)